MALFLLIPRATVRTANTHLYPPLHSSRLADFAVAARAGASPRPIATLSSGKSKLLPSGVAPLFVRKERVEMVRRRQSFVCAWGPYRIEWISAVSIVVLMFSKGTAIHKPFLALLFLLQAPPGLVSWIRGDYGTWTVFLSLLARLLYFSPGNINLPFITTLLIMAAPKQVLARRAGSLRKALDLDQGTLAATLALICILAVSSFYFILNCGALYGISRRQL